MILEIKDFATDQEVRWCPGCGDYAILRALQKALVNLNVNKEEQVCFSGIGCSSRLPYYLDIFGLHTIHGRACAVATGFAMMHKNTKPWIITGDGDGLSIGVGHLHHTLRRDIDCQILLFNNEIYGLTKGQISPTSRKGTISPSSPSGSNENQCHIGSFSLSSGASFFARMTDVDKRLSDVFSASYEHNGVAMVEILQNCIVYNPDIFAKFVDKKSKEETTIMVEHDKPLIFANGKKALFWQGQDIIAKEINAQNENNIIIHNENDKKLAYILSLMDGNDLPLAIGIIYNKNNLNNSKNINNYSLDIDINLYKTYIEKFIK